MMRVTIQLTWVLAMASIVGATETIPEPDLILHGHVCLSGGPAGDTDDVTVMARATVGNETPVVGSYHMGDQASASDCRGNSDCYVLRVRVETVPNGVSPSGTAAVLTPQAPTTVSLYLKEEAGAEVPVGEVLLTDRGIIRRLDVSPEPVSADINADTQTNSADFALLHAALAGPDAPTNLACDPNDINRDGNVDMRDFAVLQADFE